MPTRWFKRLALAQLLGLGCAFVLGRQRPDQTCTSPAAARAVRASAPTAGATATGSGLQSIPSKYYRASTELHTSLAFKHQAPFRNLAVRNLPFRDLRLRRL